jgi:hypothetical protein
MCLLRGSLCYWILKKHLGDYTQDDLSIFFVSCVLHVSMCLLRGSLCYWILKKGLRDYTQDDLSIFCFMSFAYVYVFT